MPRRKKPDWFHMGKTGEPVFPAEAVRREWWYEPGETYVFQIREPGGAWSAVLGEYEEKGYPNWVAEALNTVVNLHPRTAWVNAGAPPPPPERGPLRRQGFKPLSNRGPDPRLRRNSWLVK